MHYTKKMNKKEKSFNVVEKIDFQTRSRYACRGNNLCNMEFWLAENISQLFPIDCYSGNRIGSAGLWSVFCLIVVG